MCFQVHDNLSLHVSLVSVVCTHRTPECHDFSITCVAPHDFLHLNDCVAPQDADTRVTSSYMHAPQMECCV